MANVPIFITSLARRRAEFVAEMEYHQRFVKKARDAIATIDRTLSLFDTGHLARAEKRRYRAKDHPFKWNDCSKLVLKAVRDAGKPITGPDVRVAITSAQGIPQETRIQRRTISRKVATALCDKCRQGLLRRAGKIGNLILWEAVPLDDRGKPGAKARIERCREGKESRAPQIAWRENNRRISNGEQFHAVTAAALLSGPSAKWRGYWQRRAA
jgi:hypothetical protein